MPATAASSVAGGGVLALITTGGGSLLWRNSGLDPRPVVPVNKGDLLISDWPSEHPLAPIDMLPECTFWNFSVAYEATVCSHFTLSRTSNAQHQARRRALRCAAASGAECVLSPEVGLAIPAAFVANAPASDNMVTMILGPRLIPHESEQKYVRLKIPTTLDEGTMATLSSRTVTVFLNHTIRAQYMADSSLQDKIFEGAPAYCIQLLRLAFEDKCWDLLD